MLIKGLPDRDATPFDLLTDRYLAYQLDDPAGAKEPLADMLASTLKSERRDGQPCLRSASDPSGSGSLDLGIVPLTFREEVRRAQAARSKGWLALLASEVRKQRFERDGLKLVADAQWKLKDYTGARESWEAIRDTDPLCANVRETLESPEIREQGDGENP